MSKIDSTTTQPQPEKTSGADVWVCCGGPASPESEACCVRDADAKATGLEGCGCGAPAPTSQDQQRSGCC